MLRLCTTHHALSTTGRARLNLVGTFSTTAIRDAANRAVVFTEKGNPAEVLRVQSYNPVPPPPPDSVNVRFRLSPINPSDINVVQGVYPASPMQMQLSGEDVFVGGNEGLAEIVEVGSDVQGLQKGDWVVSGKAQAGTWSSLRTLRGEDLIKLPAKQLSEVNAATITASRTCHVNLDVCLTNLSR